MKENFSLALDFLSKCENVFICTDIKHNLYFLQSANEGENDDLMDNSSLIKVSFKTQKYLFLNYSKTDYFLKCLDPKSILHWWKYSPNEVLFSLKNRCLWQPLNVWYNEKWMTSFSEKEISLKQLRPIQIWVWQILWSLQQWVVLSWSSILFLRMTSPFWRNCNK